jgi:hypothetical protein
LVGFFSPGSVYIIIKVKIFFSVNILSALAHHKSKKGI